MMPQDRDDQSSDSESESDDSASQSENPYANLPERLPEWEDRSGHNSVREREYKDNDTRKE
jgi:hypothetical protein